MWSCACPSAQISSWNCSFPPHTDHDINLNLSVLYTAHHLPMHQPGRFSLMNYWQRLHVAVLVWYIFGWSVVQLTGCVYREKPGSSPQLPLWAQDKLVWPSVAAQPPTQKTAFLQLTFTVSFPKSSICSWHILHAAPLDKAFCTMSPNTIYVGAIPGFLKPAGYL